MYKRRAERGKEEVIDIGISNDIFSICYDSGKEIFYKNIDKLIQSLGISNRLGDYKRFRAFLTDPETYIFEEELLENNRKMLENIKIDPKSFVESLEVQVTPIPNPHNYQEISTLWQEKFSNINLHVKNLEMFDYSLSCMDNSPYAGLWAKGNHLLLTLENVQSSVFGRTIIHRDGYKNFHNNIYAIDTLHPNSYIEQLRKLIEERINQELKERDIISLDRPIENLDNDFIVGWQEEVDYKDDIAIKKPVVPYIDNPLSRNNGVIGLVLDQDKALVVPTKEATHVFIPFENVCLPLTIEQQEIVKKSSESFLLLSIVRSFAKEADDFLKKIASSELLKSQAIASQDSYLNMNNITKIKNYDEVLESPIEYIPYLIEQRNSREEYVYFHRESQNENEIEL
jgi:hypothetical protein